MERHRRICEFLDRPGLLSDQLVPRCMLGLFHGIDLDDLSAAGPQRRAALPRTHAGGGSDCFSGSGAKTSPGEAAEERSVFGGRADTETLRQFQAGSLKSGDV